MSYGWTGHTKRRCGGAQNIDPKSQLDSYLVCKLSNRDLVLAEKRLRRLGALLGLWTFLCPVG